MDYAGVAPDSFSLYVFDLDGTLVDSLADLALSVNWILAREGFPPVGDETVRRAVGNGARNLLARCFAAAASSPGGEGRTVPDAQAMDRVLEAYRAHYDAHCAEHTALYPGMREWLESLAARGKSLTVLTNKPENATRLLLRALGIEGFFAVIAGPESSGALKPDPAGLEAIMQAVGAGEKDTVMVGDSSVDVETARNAGIAVCAITGGLGDEAALREALRAAESDGLPVWLIERP